MRHVFGGFGVIAALILLAVSAAMNWQFGYSLGKTQFDSHILGAASIAADCMKALMPFFIFAAIRERNWSQALGGSALWAVCILYAMSSAIGFASTNRSDTTTTRAVYAAKYEDLRSELGRITQERSWLAKHRSAAAVQSEIAAIKQNLRWTTSKGCTDATLEESRELCTNYHKLNSELAAARQDDVLKQRAAEVRSRLAPLQSGPGISVADPQADIIAKLTGLDINRVETGMSILVMLLVELGSSLGLYVSTSAWRIHEPLRKPAPEPAKVVEITRPVELVPQPSPVKLALPKSDIETYMETRIRQDDGASVTALALYDDYCDWCQAARRQPVGLPIFSRQLTEFGVQKAKIAGKIRYIGIRVRGGVEDDEDGGDLAAVS